MQRLSFLFSLAWASAWNRRLTLGLTLLSIVVATCLLLTVERLRHDARESFSAAVSGTDLIVGARGSPMQLVLYSVFRLGEPSQTLSWASYQALSQHPAVAWSIPLVLGDHHAGYPVVGTSPDYFQHFRYGLKSPLEFAQGRAFAHDRHTLFEAVLGAEVAEKLGYGIGSHIALSHGSESLHPEDHEHDDKPLTVVGILTPTGTPVDRSVHISLQTFEALHLEWQGGIPLPGLHIPADEVHAFDLTPKQLTAVLLGLHQRTQVFQMQRNIQQLSAEPLQAVLPGIVLDQLWQTLAWGERLLAAFSWLTLLLGLTGLLAVTLAALDQRRRELAILRALGAGRSDLVQLLLLEHLMLGLLGTTLGWALHYLGGQLAAPWLSAQWGILLSPALLPPDALILLSLIVGATLSLALLPAWRASRHALSDGLTPRL